MSSAKPSIRALVVDDEEPARRYVTLLLRQDPAIGSVIECGSGPEAIEAWAWRSLSSTSKKASRTGVTGCPQDRQ